MSQIPVFMALSHLACHEQQDDELPVIDSEDDEPYVIVLSVQLAASGLMGLMPSGELFQIGPLEDVDAGTHRSAPANTLWGLRGEATALDSADHAILFIALLEHDNADPALVFSSTAGPVSAGLVGLWANAQARADQSQEEKLDLFVEDVRRSLEQTLDTFRSIRPPTAVIDPDDLIGPVQVLRWDQSEVDLATTHRQRVSRTLTFRGDGAHYDLTIELWSAATSVGEAFERLTGRRTGSLAQVAAGRPASVRAWPRSVR